MDGTVPILGLIILLALIISVWSFFYFLKTFTQSFDDDAALQLCKINSITLAALSVLIFTARKGVFGDMFIYVAIACIISIFTYLHTKKRTSNC